MPSPRQTALRPHDVAVALELALSPGKGYEALAKAVGLSLSEAHAAVQRLTHAKLLAPDGRRVLASALLEFLIAGVPHAFPPDLGQETRGVPTAHSARPLASKVPSEDTLVWPSADGTTRGQSLTPLYPKATRLPATNPDLYELLTLVDALRVGRARERQRAKEILHKRLAGLARE